MAKGHEIAVGADAGAFEKGIRAGVIEPVEDAQDALEKLGKSKGPASLEKSLEKAQRETKDLKKETEQTARDMERAYREAGRSISDGVGEGLEDAKNEAKSSAREGAASFSGEWEDVGDFIQETMANAFEGFGPLGAAAGIAAAIGIGVLTAEFEKQRELADQLRDRLMSAYADAAEEGRAYLDTAQIIAEAQDLMFNPDRADEYKRLLEDQKRIGADWYTIVAAHSGDLSAQQEIQAGINGLLESEAGHYETIREGVSRIRPEVQEMADRWKLVMEESERASGAVVEYQRFIEEAGEAERAQIDRTNQAATDRYTGLAALYNKPIQTRVLVDVDTTPAERHVAQIIRDIEGKVVRLNLGAGINGRFLE